MAEIYFVSDTHFGHENILKFNDVHGTPLRSFESTEKMDEHIIACWNSVVRPHDKVYHLGDVAIAKRNVGTVSRCNGHKRLLRGNHDIFRTALYLQYFEEIGASRVMDNIIFTHIPIHPQSLGRFTGNAHGHIHTQPGMGPGYLNLSVEAISYTPVPLYYVKEQLSK